MYLVDVVYVLCVCWGCVCKTHCSPGSSLPGCTAGELTAHHSWGFTGHVTEMFAQLFLPVPCATGHLSVLHTFSTSHQALMGRRTE